MSGAVFMVGDVRKRMAELPDGHFDLIITSPPFLALRSYLPEGHPDKALEIGSEATPAAYLDVLLALTAEWGRLLAPHGSIAIELGDTYAGSGGAGGDYNEDGLREGQGKFAGSATNGRRSRAQDEGLGIISIPGWPLDKSLTCIPALYQVALVYGINPLTGRASPAGRWRIRNLKPWVRSNPPVGALGNKERPATSYIIVATQSRDRWFDLDAVRTPPSPSTVASPRTVRASGTKGDPAGHHDDLGSYAGNEHPAGAPPLDWYHPIDATINAVLDDRNGKTANRRTAKGIDRQPRTGKSADRDGNWHDLDELGETNGAVGARGVHIRRALEQAGILTPQDFYDISPKGYSGAHYAVWPPELVRLLVDEMCPRRVCLTCGVPSRRIVEQTSPRIIGKLGKTSAPERIGVGGDFGAGGANITPAIYETVGWSDCGHNSWRPGRILDPFVGSGTTLAVATGMARTAVGIDLDERNAQLAVERCGMFLEVQQ